MPAARRQVGNLPHTLRHKRPVLEFRPLPFLGNPHVQTVLGTFWRGTALPFTATVRLAPLPDGDRLALHDSVPAGWRPGGRIAVLVHGLGGSHGSRYMERLTGLLLPHGVRVVRLDLRGVGRGEALARRTYHGGCSDDVRAAAAEIHRWSPSSALVLIGMSLGGNIVLKLAGEAAADPVPGLDRVVAVSPPIDLVRCAELIAQPRSWVYENYYVRRLIHQVRRRQRLLPHLPPVRFPRRTTLRMFDDLYTAPRCGFAGALDYYRRASALPYIHRIAVPAFLLSARDDPFVAVEPIEALQAPGHVQVHITRHGGHLGFLGWDGFGGVRWAERRVVEWAL
jgi:predicted alpha/beta-fold hydrolase